jgi:23S rRNA (pseudouridine1915-N3)-methyltransferase
MRLNLLYVSSQKNKGALFLEDDLVKRIKSPLKLKLKKIFCKKEFNNNEQQKNFESEQIKKYLNKNNLLFCFDKNGEKFSSESFSNFLFKQTKDIDFVIGGSLGISKKLLDSSNKLISFSDMEFSHDIFRLMAIEQIYRAQCIFNNHPYHQK